MTRDVIPDHMVPAVGPYSALDVISDQDRNAYLELVATGASMQSAAKKLGVKYMAILRLIKADKQFETDIAIARQMRNLAAEEILFEQSTVGIDEVLVHQGAIQYEYPLGYELDEMGNTKPGTVRVPVTVKKLVTSNPSLLAMLKANFPEKYRERSEVNVNQNPASTVDAVPDRITSPADRAKMIAILNKRIAARMQRDPDEDLL
jgi:hypothetical protein